MPMFGERSECILLHNWGEYERVVEEDGRVYRYRRCLDCGKYEGDLE